MILLIRQFCKRKLYLLLAVQQLFIKECFLENLFFWNKNIILDEKYVTTPLSLKIGPLIIKSGEQTQIKEIQSLLNELKKIYLSCISSILKQFLFVFYILNTLWPYIAFFMTPILILPNLYSFLQSINLFTFQKVTDFGEEPLIFPMKVFGISFS